MTDNLPREPSTREDALYMALAFYADPETYHATSFLFDPPCGEFKEDFSEDHGDDFYARPMPGKRARAALDEYLKAPPPLIYQHYKGGLYELLYLAHLETDLTPMSVYRSVTPMSVYRSVDTGSVWVRPMAEFTEKFKAVEVKL